MGKEETDGKGNVYATGGPLLGAASKAAWHSAGASWMGLVMVVGMASNSVVWAAAGLKEQA